MRVYGIKVKRNSPNISSMAIKISFINFKGGVAKTTTSVNFSACLANTKIKGKKPRVLLVDLDPQSNASLWLLGKTRFPLRNENQQEKTVYRMFLDMFPKEPKNFRFKDAVVESVVKDRHGHDVVPTLDLLPNTYEAIDLEERLMTHQGVLDYLARQLEDKEDSYDYMIFDCAPNLYYTTINALLFSNYYIVPVYPDYFSRAGVRILCKAIHERCKEYSKFATEKVELLGIILTRIKENATLDKGRAVDIENELKSLISQKYVSPDAVLFKDDYGNAINFNDSTDVGRSEESELPTIFYTPRTESVKKYTERLELFTMKVLEEIEKRS